MRHIPNPSAAFPGSNALDTQATAENRQQGEAAAHDNTPSERSAIAANKPRFIIGDTKTVSRTLRDLAGDALADEIIIVDFHAEQEGRLRAYDLLAKEFLP